MLASHTTIKSCGLANKNVKNGYNVNSILLKILEILTKQMALSSICIIYMSILVNLMHIIRLIKYLVIFGIII